MVTSDVFTHFSPCLVHCALGFDQRMIMIEQGYQGPVCLFSSNIHVRKIYIEILKFGKFLYEAATLIIILNNGLINYSFNSSNWLF